MARHCIKVIIVCSILLFLTGCGSTLTGPTYTNTVTPGLGSSSQNPEAIASSAASSIPLQVHNVIVGASPTVLTQAVCGSSITITFTATIFVNVGSNGGTVSYTWNVAGSTIPGSVTFNADETSKSITYTLSNVLVQYNTTNISATMATNAPNTVTSTPVQVAGNCTFSGAFTVTGISLSVSPASLSGIACGTSTTITYSAVVSIASNSNGGPVLLVWQFPRFHHQTKVVFTPGSTTQTATYVITEILAHRVMMPSATLASTSPNAVTSQLAGPTGTCS